MSQLRNIADLQLFPDNYNIGDTGAIMVSICEFGMGDALRVWNDGVILAGNHTLKALLQLHTAGPGILQTFAMSERPWPPTNIVQEDDGSWWVDTVPMEHLNEQEATAFAIADNEIARKSVRDKTKLAQLLHGLSDYNSRVFHSTGMNESDVAWLLAQNVPADSTTEGTGAEPWSVEEDYSDPAGDGVAEAVGHRLASLWYGMKRETEISQHMLELPPRPDVSPGATVKFQYSRTNPEETERIVKTYMRSGDRFYEPCCGWMTFSSTAKYLGFSGRGSDIWDVSIAFCRRQLESMPGAGTVDVTQADCRDTKESAEAYDYVYCNPPFFNLEPYQPNDQADLATGSYDRWLDAMAEMSYEVARILRPGGLATLVINDYRKDGVLIPMHSDFIAAVQRTSGLILHDLVIAEVISQALRFRKHDYQRRRTVKCHEYIITFMRPE